VKEQQNVLKVGSKKSKNPAKRWQKMFALNRQEKNHQKNDITMIIHPQLLPQYLKLSIKEKYIIKPQVET